MAIIKNIEALRQDLQSKLDASKTHTERNRLGQFATPENLAIDILQYAKILMADTRQVSFLDPAFGTGSFYSALLRTFPESGIKRARGYEIDSQIVSETSRLWKNFSLELFNEDFTRAKPPESEKEKANLIICNPPYVRHHHLAIEEKIRLKESVNQIGAIDLNGLSGLYCYYLCLCHLWMAKNGLSCWLIPSEFMDVKYGQQLKKYLTNYVRLLHIHRFDPKDVQFNDALVSSAVVWFTNSLSDKDYTVRFTYGGTLLKPKVIKDISLSVLKQTKKWSRYPIDPEVCIDSSNVTKLSDLFVIKRGLATGDNSFFILSREQVKKYDLPRQFLMPILPSPRFMNIDIIEPNEDGLPELEKPLFLLNCNLSEEVIKKEYPSLMKYLELGIEKGVNQGYLCKHRTPWYSQEVRSPPKYLCTYMGRQNEKNGKHFRFILNKTNAIATNSYLLLYPKPILDNAFKNNPQLVEQVWNALNNLDQGSILSEGRVYGGGLHKIEPGELSNVSAESILNVLNVKISRQTSIECY